MACAGRFPDEKKNEAPVIDHSFKNIVAFSSTIMKMSGLKESEGLLKKGPDGKVKDRRTRISYVDRKFATMAYTCLCQIIATLPSSPSIKRVVGSGCLIAMKNGKERALTCAHNISGYSIFRNSVQFFKQLLSYRMRLGEYSWCWLHKMDENVTYIHPKFDGTPDCGFDIAVCRQLETISSGMNWYKGQYKHDTVYWPCEASSLEKGYTLEISGYPGEKEGHPYTSEGTIEAVTKTKAGGHILWHNVDCTNGNSGSPIMITDERWIKRYVNKPGCTKAIIGVHTGYDSMENMNFGTLMTPSLFKWVREAEY